MAPTAWEIQNRLAAILNFARQSGKFYVDVKSNSLQKQLANFSSSDRSMAVCRDVMIKLMSRGFIPTGVSHRENCNAGDPLYGLALK
jgi:hypothetical protein